jgi:hypothetical protein
MPADSMVKRAAFGAGVSVLAGLFGVFFGAKVGGLFLACPAILPATLTLIEKNEGRKPAEDDEHGSIAGALGLVGFAVTGALLVHRGVAIAMLGASVAWVAVSMGVYLLHETLHARARGRLHPGKRG